MSGQAWPDFDGLWAALDPLRPGIGKLWSDVARKRVELDKFWLDLEQSRAIPRRWCDTLISENLFSNVACANAGMILG